MGNSTIWGNGEGDSVLGSHGVLHVNMPDGCPIILCSAQPEHDSASSAIAHLRDEINTMMGSVDCAFIVKYHGVNFRNGRVFIYMEPLAASLDKCYDVLKQRDGIPFPEFVLTYIAISILKAMLYLKHQLNVLHRDIKPQNILAGSEGEVKVTDFGLAKAMGSGVGDTRVIVLRHRSTMPLRVLRALRALHALHALRCFGRGSPAFLRRHKLAPTPVS